MKNHKVLLSDPGFMSEKVIDDTHLAELKAIAEVVKILPVSDEEMIASLRDVDAIMLSDYPFSSKIIDNTERLKIISRVGVGYDNIDLTAATRKRIIVTNVPGAFSLSVAEHTLLLILAVTRRLVTGDKNVREEQWGNFFKHPPSFELSGKTLGLVGFGAIGTAVSQMAKAFNMKILVYDPYVDPNKIGTLGGKRVELDELMRESDVVSVHSPLTAETKKLIGEAELNLMKSSAILINTARGAIIDENSLIDALKSRRIAGAGLDVFTIEPLRRGNPLLELDNVTLTPHSAAYSLEALKRLWVACSDAIMRVLRGELPQPPANIVNLDVIDLLKSSGE